MMLDKNFNEIKIGDKVLFSIKDWWYEANVIDIDNNYIYVKRTTTGNGFGNVSFYNKTECRQYIKVITTHPQN